MIARGDKICLFFLLQGELKAPKTIRLGQETQDRRGHGKAHVCLFKGGCVLDSLSNQQPNLLLRRGKVINIRVYHMPYLYTRQAKNIGQMQIFSTWIYDLYILQYPQLNILIKMTTAHSNDFMPLVDNEFDKI